MPRVSRAETEKNRAKIESVSSRLIRERGLSVSVADLMGAAGLTPGGFYGHFESKDALAAIACSAAFAESVERWQQRIASADGDQQAAHTLLIERYLTTENRAAPGASCPTAALAVDVAREDPDKPVRAAFHEGLEQLVALLASTQPASKDADQRRADALAEFSTLVGALVLARATQGQDVSDEILAAARAHLLVP